MGEAFRGSGGSGSGVVTYTVPRDQLLRLEILTFTLVTDATAGIHKARVILTDSTLGVTARLRDLNEAPPSATLRYTYGIGLSGSACAAVDGWEMTDALPDTVLAPSTTITLASVNDAGTTIAGDAFSSVVLFGDMVSAIAAGGDSDLPELLPGYLPGSSDGG